MNMDTTKQKEIPFFFLVSGRNSIAFNPSPDHLNTQTPTMYHWSWTLNPKSKHISINSKHHHFNSYLHSSREKHSVYIKMLSNMHFYSSTMFLHCSSPQPPPISSSIFEVNSLRFAQTHTDTLIWSYPTSNSPLSIQLLITVTKASNQICSTRPTMSKCEFCMCTSQWRT